MEKIKSSSAIILALLILFAGSSYALESEMFTCMAYSTSAQQRNSRVRMTIAIDEYTADEEMLAYIDIFKNESQDKLKAAIEKVNKGWTQPRGEVRETFNFARSYTTKGGRILVLVKSRDYRNKEFGASAKRSREFRFTYILMQLNEKGEGQGYMFPATSMQFDAQGRITLPQRGADYVTLQNIEPKK